MRLSSAHLGSALPALAGGLVLAWAATATAAPAAAGAPPAAAAPPAAPIFYCPTGPAKAPACPTPPPAHVAAAHPHAHHYREVRVAERRTRAPREDVSASQAFIYRYEQAQHGLDARAADEAWGHGPPPPCRDERGCPPHHEWAEAPPPPRVIVERAPPQPPQVIVERAPPPPPQVIIERAPPPPPRVIIEHPPAPPPQIVFERAPPPPPQVIYERAPSACPDRCPPTPYGYEDRSEGAGYMAERHESERSGGWRYSEHDGQGQYQAWGDAPRRRPCPPPVPAANCSADAAGYASAGYGRSGYGRSGYGQSGYGQGAYAQSAYAQGGYYASSAYASGEGGWRDGSYGRVYPYSGRDSGGYLVWPGKTGQ